MTSKEKVRTILVAEDDTVTSRILEKNIKRWGYDVLVARSGNEAWQHLATPDLRLAILDWVMPEVDGPELCRRVRRRIAPVYTYLILLTGRDRPQDIVEGLRAGADDYMTKPVNFLELQARLQTGLRIIDLEDKLLESKGRLQELAERDSLTSLWNRATILRFLQDELERGAKGGYPTGVIMLDLDNFKGINDSGGHKAGDRILQVLAAEMNKCVRPCDRIGRYGGDEMLVVLSHCTLDHAVQVAERLRAQWAGKRIKFGGHSFFLTVSIGCTSSECYSQPTADDLIQSSDRELYRAKHSGRNHVAVSHELHAPAKESANGG